MGDDEDSYPYSSGSSSTNGNCAYKSSNNVLKYKGYKIEEGICSWTEYYNETALTDALYREGPVAVSIDASQTGFHFYEGGVYYDRNCDREHSNHAVLATGYGVTEQNFPYYIVKNSWG